MFFGCPGFVSQFFGVRRNTPHTPLNGRANRPSKAFMLLMSSEAERPLLSGGEGHGFASDLQEHLPYPPGSTAGGCSDGGNAHQGDGVVERLLCVIILFWLFRVGWG